MTTNKHLSSLISLFEKWAGEKSTGSYKLPQSGSNRIYYRIISKNKTAIGVFNNNKKENIAFIEFTKTFLKNELNVPQIYDADLSNNIYLIQDLGDYTLFNFIHEPETSEKQILNIYKDVIEQLLKFQVGATGDINYNGCYPRASFDKQSILWDLNYFKYYFLKLAKINFDEQELEDDFNKLADYLLTTDCNYFMYRDFQSRNIMLHNYTTYFIDYQGGRKGALQYDLASLLYQAKADLPQNIRDELLNYYIIKAKDLTDIDEKEFIKFYYAYVLIRIIQVLGAYGYRGFYEKKSYFIQSIPYAIENLKHVLKKINIPIKIPALNNVLNQIINSQELTVKQDIKKSDKLTVTITSFSYKKGIPIDISGNGGGFVFDCRANSNPGRYDEYKQLTGKDKQVIDFFKKDKQIFNFLEKIYSIVDSSVEIYIERNFSNLMVNFGCTGGQHRSVFCAENFAKHIENKYNVNVVIHHTVVDSSEFRVGN
ncbi:MAG: phosphotransferase enzyme family protein [Bacteroidetes bacterium]|nr:MAG: phosphotransferase enzyme family protein [Bacteroidota bacterium]